MYSIALSAGEASGDMYGGALARELWAQRSDLVIWGAGGPHMRDAGVKVPVDMTGSGTIGISETLKSLPSIAVKYLRLRRELLRSRPDVFVPIDCGALNVRLGQVAHRHGIRVVYFLPPSSWRKRPKNADKLIACGGRVITQFPWSAELLSGQGVHARFAGHPLIDLVRPTVDRQSFFREMQLVDSLPTIGLLPGSRSHEIREHLDMMLGCARLIHEDMGGAQFVIGATVGSSEAIRRRVAELTAEVSGCPQIRVVEGRTYDCMAHSDFLITKSGTATLEAAIFGVPMVIIYRGTAIMRFEFLFRKSVIEDYIGLPNIVAGRGICPELINDDATAHRVADVAMSIMRDEDRLAQMKMSLAEVRRQLGETGVMTRVAGFVLDMGELR